jgi:hypothetical protein
MTIAVSYFRILVLSAIVSLIASSALGGSTLLSVNYSNLVARADLHYAKAVARSEDGIPIGNGRMGTLLWTSPSAFRLQVNRVDVFGNNSASDSFFERHIDYCGGCGFVDVAFSDYGNPVFPADKTRQTLSCYDGLATALGEDVSIRALAWNRRDVIALEVNDRRNHPGTISINLRMLRPAIARTASHGVLSRFEIQDGKIILIQQFLEGTYYCASALVVAVSGRDAQPRLANDEELQLVTAPGKKPFTVWIASAASFKKDADIVASARAQLDEAAKAGFKGIEQSNREWAASFWNRSFIHLHSADGTADQLEAWYNYYLYLMAATSRGKYPVKFNGMLWTTAGDPRRWGGQYWGANQSCLYNNALDAANHLELLDPMFDMYSGMIDSCALAAKQQWGSDGLFIPETVGFDGLAPLPDDIASEMRQLYLLQKPWAERSQHFLDYAATKIPYSSRWNWIGPGKWVDGRWTYTERGGGPFGPVTHTFGRSAKIAYQYWLRYEYSGDQTWLRDRAYPIIRGIAEFYRNFPNLKKEADGRFHIHHVNSNESVWGATDTDEEISGMMGILPVAMRSSTILGLDADKRALWEDLLAHLAPLPRSDLPDAPPSRASGGEPVWIRGLNPIVRGNGGSRPDGNTMPMWFFDLCTLESDPATLKIGNATFNAYLQPGTNGMRRTGVLSKVPLVAAIMGRADAVKRLVPGQMQAGEAAVLANRMDLREGYQTTSAQRLGNAADALHTALCQDLPAGPAQPPVIRVFAAWPREWDAEYTLLCRGGFLVTSSLRNGVIEFIEVQSQLGGECRVRNAWDGDVAIIRAGRKPETISGSLFKFNTQPGETILLLRPGTKPEQYKRTIFAK